MTDTLATLRERLAQEKDSHARLKERINALVKRIKFAKKSENDDHVRRAFDALVRFVERGE